MKNCASYLNRIHMKSNNTCCNQDTILSKGIEFEIGYVCHLFIVYIAQTFTQVYIRFFKNNIQILIFKHLNLEFYEKNKKNKAPSC